MFKFIIWRYKKNAKRLKRTFTITRSDILQKLNKGYCEVTGIKFELNTISRSPFRPSVDRKDNSKGYTKDNIQLVCWIYNRTKGDGTHKDVVKLCQALIAIEKEKEAQKLLKIADVII